MSSLVHLRLDVEYALPPAIENLRQCWIATLSISAAVSSIIAGAEAQLLLFYEDAGNYTHETRPGIPPLLVGLAYVALLCSVSSLLGAMLLSALLSEMALLNALRGERRTYPMRGDHSAQSSDAHRRRYRLRSGWRLVLCYWLLNSLVAFLCTIASTAIYSATQEPPATRVIVPIVATLTALPLIGFAFIWTSSR